LIDFENNLKHAHDPIYFLEYTLDTFSYEYTHDNNYFFKRSSSSHTAHQGYVLVKTQPLISLRNTLAQTYQRQIDEYPEKEDPDWWLTWSDDQIQNWRAQQQKIVLNETAYHLAEGAAFAKLEKHIRTILTSIISEAKTTPDVNDERGEYVKPAIRLRWTGTIEQLLDTFYWLILERWIANNASETEQFALCSFEIEDKVKGISMILTGGPVQLLWETSMRKCYHMFRTLKQQGLIEATYSEIAVFIKERIKGKSKADLSTIHEELKSSDIPLKPFRNPTGSKNIYLLQRK
jgi:hypothetical protein